MSESKATREELLVLLGHYVGLVEELNNRRWIFEIPFGTGNVAMGDIIGIAGISLSWSEEAFLVGTIISGKSPVKDGSILLTFATRASYDALLKVLSRIEDRIPA